MGNALDDDLTNALAGMSLGQTQTGEGTPSRRKRPIDDEDGPGDPTKRKPKPGGGNY